MRDTLKHRLVGAAVLAAVAVLFLPSFFKEKQMSAINTKTQIPARPELVPVEYNAPQPVPNIEPAPAPETMFAGADSPGEETVLPGSSASSASSTANAHTTSTSAKTASASATSLAAMPLNEKGLPDAWVLQVGSFATKTANKLRDDLQADGYKAYVRPIPNTDRSRVFIGPQLDKAKIQALKVQIDKRLKVESAVKRFQP